MKNRFLSLALVGTLVSLVSCGSTTASNDNLKTVRTSVYDTTVDTGNARYIPSTYSANRVKYYNGLSNSYNYGQDYMYDYARSLDKDLDPYDRVTSRTIKTSAYNPYRDQRNTTSSNYMSNPYMYSNNYYSNDTYRDLSTTDFNNGLVTYEHNVDTTGINTNKLTTKALNATTADSVMRADTTNNRDNNVEVNKMNYDMGNTYNEVKDATKEIVNDVSKDAKKMVRDAKNDMKTAKNKMTY